uniref:Uncharacterized protein n=1 Tax=mine drainage metagenome TaxID=410659 RepID=E6Q9Z0_9ZZZZ
MCLFCSNHDMTLLLFPWVVLHIYMCQAETLAPSLASEFELRLWLGELICRMFGFWFTFSLLLWLHLQCALFGKGTGLSNLTISRETRLADFFQRFRCWGSG